ncbi:MAG: SoxR reducing system RseC family protein [Clostridia bacterium]|nr:SoxR reducing system RseC family protein [Clostridia bacterium]
MTQTGRVTEVTDRGIKISVVRETACGESCASCSAKCALKDQSVMAEYMPGIKKGDAVIFEMPASKVLFAAFLVYITPLLVLLAAYSAAVFAGAGEAASAAVGVVCMAVWFVVIHYLDKRLRRFYKHTIVSRIEGDG